MLKGEGKISDELIAKLMKIISFITEDEVIRQILEHLGLWQKKPSRNPPVPEDVEVTYEPYYDDYPV